MESALELTPKATNSENRAILLAMNVIGLVKEGNRDEAKEMLEEAKKIAGHLSLRINRARAYAAIAEASAQIEEADGVLHFLQKSLQNVAYSTRNVAMEVIGNLIPVFNHLGGLSLLSDVYAQIQRADRVFDD